MSGQHRLEAVLDEATTETCRFMHGKVFSVGRGLEVFERVEADPGAIYDINPWVRLGRDEDGQSMLYVKNQDRRIPIATIERSGTGLKDDIGAFRNTRSEQELMDLGVSFPPCHGMCRSNVVPVI